MQDLAYVMCETLKVGEHYQFGIPGVKPSQ